MTPAEFNVLVDSRLKHYSSTVDVMDALNALNCQVTLKNSELKMNDFKLFATSETPVEQQTEDSVSIFKQWVTVTGGETI